MLFALLALARAQTKPRVAELGDSTQKCIMCKFYVSMISDYLKQGETVEEITKKVEALCAYVKETYRPICTSLVESFVPTIIQYIQQQMETNKICIAIKFCKD